jgi:hypothetical protein
MEQELKFGQTCGMIYAGKTGTFVHTWDCLMGKDCCDTPKEHVTIPDLPTPERKPHKCPVCAGTGLVSRPPHIAGDVYTWTDNQTGPYTCNACGGVGVLWG